MYDEIVRITEDQNGCSGPNLELLKTLPPYESLREFERTLRDNNQLSFRRVFNEPVGFYLFKCFLIGDYSVDKAVFYKDVELYKALKDASARLKVGRLIYERFCNTTNTDKFRPGTSVFRTRASAKPAAAIVPAANRDIPSLSISHTNVIGVYGKLITEVRDSLHRGSAPVGLFDKVRMSVLDDLRMDVYPRFLKSNLYKKYICCKSIENQNIDIGAFNIIRILGRGAFGFVNACVKKDSGKLYAMKCISKRRVQSTDSVETILSERNFLAGMESRFVVCLQYAVMDDHYLFLVLNICLGGDLKFHLNKDEYFTERRSKFYAAEVLLGLEHIHSKNIIYRDTKLENILLDETGHASISDLGLAVQTKDRVKGYAGTPGYTAPEVVLNQPYNKLADFFSYGVMVYRFLSGKKPFASKKKAQKRKKRNRRTGELDRNVVEMCPEYPDQFFSTQAKQFLRALLQKDPRKRLGSLGLRDIKSHVWFDSIDWGLLEAGYVDPPLVPDLAEVFRDQSRHKQPPSDKKYANVIITPEFEHALRGFRFTSKRALQSEIVEVLQKADEGSNFERYGQSADGVNPNAPGKCSCCSIM